MVDLLVQIESVDWLILFKIIVNEKLKSALGSVKKIVGKGQNAGNHNVFKRLLFHCHEKTVVRGKAVYSTIQFFFTPVEDGTYNGITRGGRGGIPNLCLEHISKTMVATVMKFRGWIDLIKAECSAQES